MRCGSLIITLFGDYLVYRGGRIWLSSVIDLLSVAEMNARMIRTSFFRLKNEGWLDSDRYGRNSQYRISHQGHNKFLTAARRIYSIEPNSGEKQWDLLLTNGLGVQENQNLSRELQWHGFGYLGKGIYVHPNLNQKSLENILEQNDLTDYIVHMTISQGNLNNTDKLKKLVTNTWNLEYLGQLYREFIKVFGPLRKKLEDGDYQSQEDLFIIRLLLIHYYRWILLRDPELPNEVLPEDWSGTDARQLCRNIYLLTYREADDYLNSRSRNHNGVLPPPHSDYYNRYGGLV